MTLYDQDFAAWLLSQEELLKAGKISELDLDNLAEEIDSVRANHEWELIRQLAEIAVLLLKQKYALPDEAPGGIDMPTRLSTVRIFAEGNLELSPSLNTPEVIDKAWQEAKSELKPYLSKLPEHCPFSIEQLLDAGFTFKQVPDIAA